MNVVVESFGSTERGVVLNGGELGLFLHLARHRLAEELEEVLALACSVGGEFGVLEEEFEHLHPFLLVSCDLRATRALFQAVAVGGGRGFLEDTLMTRVASSRTLGATAEGAGESASLALVDVLVNVLLFRPSVAACIITA